MRRRLFGRANIGTVIFGMLFLYLLITILIYLTNDKVSTYMVTSGTLSTNENYNALVLRTEEVVTANVDGYATYYVQDGTKSSKNDVIMSIGSTKNSPSTANMTEADIESVRKRAVEFSRTYDPNEFHSIYDFKYSMHSSIMNGTGKAAVNGTSVKAMRDGVISFTTDGYETLTLADVTADTFRSQTTQTEQLYTDDMVTMGDKIYRVISDDVWSIVMPISDRQYAALSARSAVRVRFDKDGHSETGDINLFDRDGVHYVQIIFYSGMVRYSNERFLNVELVTNNQTGLKIPITSIVTKEFYTIPTSYLSYGGENGEAGFLLKTEDANGNATTSFVSTELYERTVGSDGIEIYYVDKSDFSRGDVLVQPDSNSTYTIGAVGTLEGVFCTNRGYAMFRRINIIDQNEEYCIVQTGTTYGISLYDYIVRDGSKVKESDVLARKNA